MSDLVILFLITALAFALRAVLPLLIPGYPEFYRNISFIWWFYPVWLAILAYEGAYTLRYTLWDEVHMLWKVAFLSTAAILVIFFLGRLGGPVSRTMVVLIGLISLSVFPPLRIAVKRLLVGSGMLASNVIILGAGEMGIMALHALRREPNLGYRVIGFVDAARPEPPACIEGIKVHGGLATVERYLRRCNVQEVVIALPQLSADELSRLVNRLQHKTTNILAFPNFAGMAVVGTELRHFFQDQLFALEIKNNLAQPLNYALKRSLDYACGLVLTALLLIPLAVIALIIRLTSPGPAIFRQERIGRNRTRFFCYKFRTMYADADERLQRILATDPEAKKEWDVYWKLKNDPRLTPVGDFLRKTSLDELPQIFNIIRGEMSLVGPRPYLQREWDALKNHSEIIHSVQPGITGLWQVSGRSDSSYEQRLILDTWYVRNWSLWLDIVILLKTVKVVVMKEGAR